MKLRIPTQRTPFSFTLLSALALWVVGFSDAAHCSVGGCIEGNQALAAKTASATPLEDYSDPEVFSANLTRTEPKLRRMVELMVAQRSKSTPGLVDDIVQEVWLTLWSSRDEIRDFEARAFAVARYRFLGMRSKIEDRRKKESTFSSDRTDALDTIGRSSAEFKGSRQSDLLDQMEKLIPPQAAAVLALAKQGAAIVTIAASLKLSEQRVEEIISEIQLQTRRLSGPRTSRLERLLSFKQFSEMTARFPQKQRQALLAWFSNPQRGYVEVMGRLGVTEQALWGLLTRGYRRLKKENPELPDSRDQVAIVDGGSGQYIQELFNMGQSIESIAAQLDLPASTVVRYTDEFEIARLTGQAPWQSTQASRILSEPQFEQILVSVSPNDREIARLVYLDFLKQDEVSELLGRMPQVQVSRALSRVSAQVAKALGLKKLGSRDYAVVPNFVIPTILETVGEKQQRATQPAGNSSEFVLSDAEFEKLADTLFPTPRIKAIYKAYRLGGLSEQKTAEMFGTGVPTVFKYASVFDKKIRHQLGIPSNRPIVGEVRPDEARQKIPTDFVVINQSDFDNGLAMPIGRWKKRQPALRRCILRMILLEKMSTEAVAKLLKVSVEKIELEIRLGANHLASFLGVARVTPRRLLVVPDSIRTQYVDNE